MVNKLRNTRIDRGGRLVIPADYRKALGLNPGDEVSLRLEDGEIRVASKRRAIVQAQHLLRRYIPAGRTLSEELIRERREETPDG
jgi:AbrB family looped-hinge helix DNA binding protein